MVRRSAHELCGGGGSHSGCHAYLGLASPYGPGYGGVAHGQIANGAGVVKGRQEGFVAKAVFLL